MGLAALFGTVVGWVLLRVVGRRKMMMLSQIALVLASGLFIYAHKKQNGGF